MRVRILLAMGVFAMGVFLSTLACSSAPIPKGVPLRHGANAYLLGPENPLVCASLQDYRRALHRGKARCLKWKGGSAVRIIDWTYDSLGVSRITKFTVVRVSNEEDAIGYLSIGDIVPIISRGKDVIVTNEHVCSKLGRPCFGTVVAQVGGTDVLVRVDGAVRSVGVRDVLDTNAYPFAFFDDPFNATRRQHR